jgi:hypothetical protein
MHHYLVPVILNAPIVADGFNRADNASSMGNTNTGQAWQTLAGTFGIQSNQAYLAVGVAGNISLAYVNSGIANCTIEATFVIINQGVALVARVTDLLNYLSLEYDVASTSIRIYTRILGVYTLLASFTNALLAGDVVRFEVNGSSLRGYVNGVLKISTTSTFNQTVTNHGIRPVDTVPSKYDNFKVEAL